VTKTDNAATDFRSPLARVAWIVLILATLYISYFSNLGAIGFIGPDEPRYAWIARNMAETGDWITPRLYGKPWFEKPPLYYWGAAFSFKLFGVSEWAARLPSAIAALLATLAMAWLAWKVYGTETARWVLLLLPTTAGMIGFSHAAATDMPFAGMLTMVMVFAACVIGVIPFPRSGSSGSTRLFMLFLFGLFLGLAVLAKGPAGIVLSGGAVLLWSAFTKRWRDGFRCLHPVAIAGFCLTALPWYILCAQRNPTFLRVFIIEHNFKRYLTPEFQHIQPFWFYVPVLIVCLVPWVFWLIWTVWDGLRNVAFWLPKSPMVILLASWSCFCVVFFSISKSKLPGYILPAVPPLGVLLASRFVRAPRNPKWVGVFLGAIGCALVVAATELTRQAQVQGSTANLPKAMMLSGVVALLGLVACSNWLLAGAYFMWKYEEVREGFRCFAIVIVGIALIIWPRFINQYQRGAISPKVVAEGLHQRGTPVGQVFVWKNASRAWRYGASFYLHAEINEWNPNNRQEAYVITGTTACSDLPTNGYESKIVPVKGQAGEWFVCQMIPVSSVGGFGQLGSFGGRSGSGTGR
jgi:4-amino-4-deoxy-L-arabinose transferase-like glycosyltransferase